MSPKTQPRIIALNLPAGLNHETVGNPVVTRLETVPANCFPGLDIDVRNLDRRFFPGLLFNFQDIDDGDPRVLTRGAILMAADPSDPDIEANQKTLQEQLTSLQGMLPNATILLDSLTIEGANTIPLTDSQGVPFNWRAAWRIVRSLPPGPLKVALCSLTGGRRVPLMTLHGKRRIYQKTTGELSEAYQPGELTQSLCSPWQHDFRDCSCTYWATNHPDIVMAAYPADVELDPRAEGAHAQDPIVWMRWDREKPVPPRPTSDGTRALEMDHYEINQRWRELSFVLEGREQLTPWMPIDPGGPGPAESDPITDLKTLAGMEQALALEYLYARYTLPFYEELDAESQKFAAFIAHELLNIAIGEMLHLRWANELLQKVQLLAGQPAAPELRVSRFVPGLATSAAPDRPAEDRPIDRAIRDFVAAELPSGTLQGRYAKILSLLKQGWPKPGDIQPDLIELVERIVADGTEHYSRFLEIETLLSRPGLRLVKSLTDLPENSIEFYEAEKLYEKVIAKLTPALISGSDLASATEAHQAMLELDRFAQDMAKKGAAVPFIAIANRYWTSR